jgi:hypothetical protein
LEEQAGVVTFQKSVNCTELRLNGYGLDARVAQGRIWELEVMSLIVSKLLCIDLGYQRLQAVLRAESTKSSQLRIGFF